MPTPIALVRRPGLRLEEGLVTFGDRQPIDLQLAIAQWQGYVDALSAEDLGLAVATIRAPGTLDGGDVLKVGDTVYVGRGGRTNGEGIGQLRRILSTTTHDRVVAVPVSSVLHLKSAVTALPDGTVIGYPPLVDHAGLFPTFLPVSEESGAHVVLLATAS